MVNVGEATKEVYKWIRAEKKWQWWAGWCWILWKEVKGFFFSSSLSLLLFRSSHRLCWCGVYAKEIMTFKVLFFTLSLSTMKDLLLLMKLNGWPRLNKVLLKKILFLYTRTIFFFPVAERVGREVVQALLSRISGVFPSTMESSLLSIMVKGLCFFCITFFHLTSTFFLSCLSIFFLGAFGYGSVTIFLCGYEEPWNAKRNRSSTILYRRVLTTEGPHTGQFFFSSNTRSSNSFLYNLRCGLQLTIQMG